MHLEDEDVMGVIRGLEINWFILDQAEEISEEVFDTLMSRLGRWDRAEVTPTALQLFGQSEESWPWKGHNGKPLVPTYPMIACNPDTEMHWIYRRFHPESPEWKERYSPEGYRMISMSSLDNKFLPQQNRNLLMGMDETFKRRFVFGEWGIPEGQIHEIDPESIIPGTPEVVAYIKSRCILGRSLDHGDSSPTCCGWWGIDADGNMFFFREYYKPNALVSTHRENITALSQGEKYRYNLADPSMWKQFQQKHGGRYHYADDYADRNPLHGFNPQNAIDWTEADNEELGTRILINELLRKQGCGEYGPDGKEKPRVHPLKNEMGYWPRLFFVTKTDAYPYGCDQIIRQTRSQRREKIGTELGRPIFSDDRDESIPDHAYDVVRYGVASRAAAPKVPPKNYSTKSFNGIRDQYLKFKRMGGHRLLAEMAARR